LVSHPIINTVTSAIEESKNFFIFLNLVDAKLMFFFK
jgi:hypothetical protein